MNIPNARERILDTAVKIFAEKSYEGSRIDEIAKEANVPKSLIYYHFKSKEEILQVLIENFTNEYLALIEDGVGESHQEKSENLVHKMKNKYYEFGIRNADLVRVILIDSLKKGKEELILFRIVDAMIAKEVSGKEGSDVDIQERRIAEFFTSFMPNYAYICFGESWVKYFNIKKERFDELYLKVYEDTHGAYHKNHDKEN